MSQITQGVICAAMVSIALSMLTIAYVQLPEITRSTAAIVNFCTATTSGTVWPPL